MYIFQLYHQFSKQKSKEPKPSKEKVELPDQWKTTYIKLYERFPLFVFSPPTFDDKKSLFSIIYSRRSGRTFGNVIDKQLLSNLLYFSIGEVDKEKGDGVGRRVYPSGGARYPLEFYVVLFKNVEDLHTGVYHYDIEAHGLRKIRNIVPDSAYIAEKVGYSFVQNATFAVIFTGTFSRSFEKYGEKAYRFTLIEAGGVMQNFSLVSESLSIDSVSMGALAEDIFEPLLGIDGSVESCVHAMYFG